MTTQLEMDGQVVQVSHSQLDMGSRRTVSTAIRSRSCVVVEANPLVFDFVFLRPRIPERLSATFASMEFTS